MRKITIIYDNEAIGKFGKLSIVYRRLSAYGVQIIGTILRLLPFVCASVIFTSCLTVRQIERNCDSFYAICVTEETNTVTTIHDTAWIEKRDTVVSYYLVRDTVQNTVFLPSVERSLSSDTSILSTGLARSKAFIYNSRLFHYLESGDTILNIRLNNAITENNRLRKVITDVNTINSVTVLKDTPFGNFCKKWFFGTIIIISGILVVILLKKKIF